MSALHIASGAVALAVAVLPFHLVVFRWSLNTEAFLRMVVRLVEKGDVARAAKLCAAAPDTLVAQATAAVVRVALDGPDEPLPALAAAARQGLEAGEASVRRGTMLVLASGIGLTLSALLGLGAPVEGPPVGWILNAGCALLLAWTGLSLRRLRDGLQRTPVWVVTPLVAHLTLRTPTPDEVVAAVLGG
jgi:hypothetical protein